MQSNYNSTRIERGKLLRQSLENNTKQDFLPQKVNLNEQQNIKKENIFIEKNSVLSSSSIEMEKLGAIDRLKREYGIEKNVVLTKENVEENRQLIEKYIEFFSAYPDSE